MSRSCPLWACLRLLSSIILSYLINHVCTVISVFGSSFDMYQVFFMYLIRRPLFSPYPSRLLLSVRVQVLILEGYENLHVHFEDCVGRRVTNTSGALLELAPSSGSSSDVFHSNMQQYLCLPSCFSVVPLATPGIPYFARLTE